MSGENRRLHEALKKAFGDSLTRDEIARAEDEFSDLNTAMVGCGDVTGLSAIALLVLFGLNGAFLFFGKPAPLQGTHFVIVTVAGIAGLAWYGTTAVMRVRSDAARERESISLVIEEIKELRMGDTNINKGQAGIIGSHGHAHDMNFIQTWQELDGGIDLHALATELSQLLPKLTAAATDTEQFKAMAAVSGARDSAVKGDGPSTLKYLSSVGGWVLGAARDLGIKVAVSAIEKSLGLK